MKKFLAVLAILLFTHCSVMAESVIVSYNRAGGVVSVTRGAGAPMGPYHALRALENRRPNYRPCSGCTNGRYKRACHYGKPGERHYKRPYDRAGHRRMAMTRKMRLEQIALAKQKLALSEKPTPKITAPKTKTFKPYTRNGITYFY